MAMGSYNQFLCPFLLIISMVILTSSSSSQAYKFIVGGKDGWVVKPSEKYNHWAERNRFQVNDTIYFKYKKGCDSVAVVTKENYDSCNAKNPIHIMKSGESTFQFNRSGPFFFISGNVENCKQEQKLIVVVLALTHHHHNDQSPPPAAPPSLAPSPGSGSPPKPSEGPTGIVSPAPAPSSKHSGSTRLGGFAWGATSVGVALLFLVFA